MPITVVFDDLGGEEIFDARRVGTVMRAERRAKGIGSAEEMARLLRSRFQIPVTTRKYEEMENGSRAIPLAVFLAFIYMVRPRGMLSFAVEGMSEPALDALGLTSD